MIDGSDILLTLVRNRLDSELGKENYNMSSEFIQRPAKFPYVWIQQTNNFTVNRDNTPTEKYAVHTYAVRVYSNKQVGRKQEALRISGIINEVFNTLNFERYSALMDKNPSAGTVYTNDTHDENIYGWLTNYEGVVGADNTFYRR